jgi:uncharacterized protein YbjT (DUF2867 family)
MILVAGATGELGSLIVRKLLDKGVAVRVLVRSASNYEDLVEGGAEPAFGDLKDSSTLDAACLDVDAVVTTATAAARGGDDTIESVDLMGNRNLVRAADRAGVARFVLVSALGAALDSQMPLLKAKATTEEELRNSSMSWTILQPDVFIDRLVPLVVGVSILEDRPVTLVGEGRRRHSFVAMRDVAAYAVAAVTRHDSEARTLAVGGPEPVSWRDIVHAFSDELGKEVPVYTVDLGEPIPALPEFATSLLAALETYDSPLDMTELTRMYGITPTNLAAFVHDFAAAHHVKVP